MSLLQRLFDATAATANRLDEVAFEAETSYWAQKPYDNTDGVKATAAIVASKSLAAVCKGAEIVAEKADRPLDTSKLRI